MKRKITGLHEIFREGVVENQENYGREKDPRTQLNVINCGEMKHCVIICPRIIIFIECEDEQ